ncbi:MAG: hypothetical protein ACRDE8_01645 [Ginsengibacter sp.]
MSEIIALEGPFKKGKSLTMGVLYEQMKKRGYKLLQDRRIPDSKDFTAIFQKNNTKIGVASYGYSANLIRHYLNLFFENGCEIIVCTCFPGGVTKEVVENYHGYTSIYIPKTLSTYKSNRVLANISDAQHILGEIEKHL